MKYQYIQEYLSHNNLNFMTSFAGYDERLDKDLNNTLRIYELISEAIETIWEKSNGISNESPWITDSVINLQRGIELINSSIFLLLNNHLPANSYLFRSSLNCFWFSHEFIKNGKSWEKYDKNKKMSHVEIGHSQLYQIIGQDDEVEEGIIRTFSGILHNEFNQGWRFIKSSGGTNFELSPHDFETEDLVDNFKESVTNIRGILEFARAVIQSTFVDLEPDCLLKGKYFKPNNIHSLFYKDYRILLENLKTNENVDLSLYF